eukprot:COSAG04_NODE_2895_length_3410_cov_4.133494_1_plen_113_part_00
MAAEEADKGDGPAGPPDVLPGAVQGRETALVVGALRLPEWLAVPAATQDLIRVAADDAESTAAEDWEASEEDALSIVAHRDNGAMAREPGAGAGAGARAGSSDGMRSKLCWY